MQFCPVQIRVRVWNPNVQLHGNLTLMILFAAARESFMGAAISKVGKAAEKSLRLASQRASKSLKPSKAASTDILPTRAKSATQPSSRQEHLSRHLSSKKAVGEALRAKDGVPHAKVSQGGAAGKDPDRQPARAGRSSAATEPAAKVDAKAAQSAPGPHRKQPGGRAHASHQDGHEPPTDLQAVDAAYTRTTSAKRTQAKECPDPDAAMDRAGQGLQARPDRRPQGTGRAASGADTSRAEHPGLQAANSMGPGRALLGSGPSSSSFPLLPRASSAAAQYDSLYGGDWRLGTAPYHPSGPEHGELETLIDIPDLRCCITISYSIDACQKSHQAPVAGSLLKSSMS